MGKVPFPGFGKRAGETHWLGREEGMGDEFSFVQVESEFGEIL